MARPALPLAASAGVGHALACPIARRRLPRAASRLPDGHLRRLELHHHCVEISRSYDRMNRVPLPLVSPTRRSAHLVARGHALRAWAAPLVSGCVHTLRRLVRQPILAAAGFQPAPGVSTLVRPVVEQTTVLCRLSPRAFGPRNFMHNRCQRWGMLQLANRPEGRGFSILSFARHRRIARATASVPGRA